MKRSMSIPAFIFKPVTSKNTTKEILKRQDDVLELEFPIYDKNEVLAIAEKLSMRRRRAHDRSIEDLIEIIEQVGNLWQNPNYDLRKEALEIIPMTSGQSRQLCEFELNGSLQLWNRHTVEMTLREELGGKEFLDSWVSKGGMKLHAQPRGLIYHNLAGNAFSVGLLSLMNGLITKNVNLLKLPREEPYFAVKLAESIAEIDKKIAKEIAVLYWSGSKGEIFDALFNSGLVDGVIAWGGLQSIEDIRRRAYRFGIKIIDHGPKLSFSIVSEDLLKDAGQMRNIARKLSMDIAFWNQKACVSPRVIYIKEASAQTRTVSSQATPVAAPSPLSGVNAAYDALSNLNSKEDVFGANIISQMQRSIKFLGKEITDSSPLGFARIIAEELKNTDGIFPTSHWTQADGLEIARKREYFTMKYTFAEEATIITPPKDGLNWTVVYLRNPPTMQEIDMCMNRFLIVTRLASLSDLIHSVRKEKLQQYLQTVSVYGSDAFVEEVAEEFSLLGACRFPRAGEHNSQKIGAPWDGHYFLQDLVRWVYIGFLSQEEEMSDQDTIGMQKGIPKMVPRLEPES